MAKDASTKLQNKPTSARDQARRMAAALDAIEERLDALGPGADAETVAAALAEPVRVFGQAAADGIREA